MPSTHIETPAMLRESVLNNRVNILEGKVELQQEQINDLIRAVRMLKIALKDLEA